MVMCRTNNFASCHHSLTKVLVTTSQIRIEPLPRRYGNAVTCDFASVEGASRTMSTREIRERVQLLVAG